MSEDLARQLDLADANMYLCSDDLRPSETQLDQGFSTGGPQTPGVRRELPRGPRATPEKLETRRILTKQKYRPYQCCRYKLQRTELKTSLVFATLCLKSELD